MMSLYIKTVVVQPPLQNYKRLRTKHQIFNRANTLSFESGCTMARTSTKAEKEAGLVMGVSGTFLDFLIGYSDSEGSSFLQTNNSSIVSKRSVERLYYPEPHFFRYFVKKPQRRSPLINRGYWLRMYAIEHSVRRFLSEPSQRPKVILNFGCGL